MYQLLAKLKHPTEQLWWCSKNEWLGFQLFSSGWARNRHFRVVSAPLPKTTDYLRRQDQERVRKLVKL